MVNTNWKEKCTEKIIEKGEIILQTLEEFDINAFIADVVVGYNVIQFQLKLAPKTKISAITNIVDELSLNLSSETAVRINNHIPGVPYIGIELNNDDETSKKACLLKEVLDNKTDKESALSIPLGYDINYKLSTIDLEKLPHLLIAGTTGSGKSVFINSCLLYLMSKNTSDELKFALIDPKMVEFAPYTNSKYLLTPIATDSEEATKVLEIVVREMEWRLNIFAQNGCTNIEEYNTGRNVSLKMSKVVMVIDEFADLMLTSKKTTEKLIVRLAQKARAAGIHLIIATQRPQATVITGLIKANISARISFALPSKIDSKIILGTNGAESLAGHGDMLYYNAETPNPIRLQGLYYTNTEKRDIIHAAA